MNDFNFNITDNNITTLVKRAIRNENNSVELNYIFEEFLKYRNCYEKVSSNLTCIVFDNIFGEYASKAIESHYLKYVNVYKENVSKELRKLNLIEFEFVLGQYVLSEPLIYGKYVELLEIDTDNEEYIPLLKECCNLLNVDLNYLLDDIEAYKIEMFFDELKINE